MQQTVNKGQIKIIHTLLGGMGMGGDKEYKEGLVRDYTNDRETSTTKLSYWEADRMIKDLQRQSGWSKDQILANHKRRRIMAIAHKLRLEKEDGSVNLEALDDWCVNYGYLHKPLNDYAVDELSTLITQIEKWYKSHLNRI